MHLRARLGMSYLTQEPSVFRKLTVEQNILAILETCKMGRAERKVRLKYLLDELDLSALAKSRAYTLSGGEKRRLEITRALVTSPKLLLLDEPFAGIDPIAVYEVQKIVRRLRDRGLGILITDHSARNAQADRSGYHREREVVIEGTAVEVNDPKARKFIGAGIQYVMLRKLRPESFDNFARDIGQAIPAAIVEVSQLLVIESSR
jgi:lipopolysaccharide export system ATP-binding protein